jgi:murein DD-endopeptidase MepM/ murein hydrolase activator NlpD
MKQLITIVSLFFAIKSFGQLTDTEIRDLKTGKVKNNSYVYWLPYAEGEKYLFVQGANSGFSHKNELSFDFKMAKGSKVCASRAGVVVAAKSDSNKGGLKSEFLDDGNHIIIQHSDGSSAQYWHLELNGVLVKVGDTVSKGQLIGYSGNTGYTAFPHLHFQVIASDGKEVLPRFQTKKGFIYIRPGRWYKAVH